MDNSRYRVDKPYPKVKISEPNPYYAALLRDDYASMVSEYTAVSQYVFDHIMTENKKTASDFMGIAIIEMQHLEMLGDVIIQLGVAPVFRNGSDSVWESDMVPYSNSIVEMLNIAIKSEYDAIFQYKQHIAAIENEDIKKLLARIIEDEEKHINIFEKDLERYT